jgi:TolB-like protein/tRNA A-37 threonylcarbamoyl transferase component Bud32
MKTLQPGRMLKQYRLIALLGSGGMGEVYLAEDTSLERKVAVKVLREGTEDEADRLRRFSREAKATSTLNHANIAQIYDFGEDGGISFLVLEYVEGQTLRVLRDKGEIAWRYLLDLAIDIASGLAAAESKGVLHRDLKPSNIMVTDSGQAKILDFGLAKIERIQDETVTEITQTGAVVGTTAYMSPEQALGRDMDYRSDIFSFGVVLYEMATGRLPFQGKTRTEILVSIVQHEPEPVAFENQVDGSKLAAIIGRCLKKDREQRYPSAAELLRDLQQLRLEGMIRNSSTGGVILESPSRRRRRALIAAVAAVAILAAGYAALHALAGRDTRSIAVLPLENQTGDAKLDYVADGLTATLIDDLSRLPHARVMSYDAVRPYKGKPGGAREAGAALKVAAVVTGRLIGDANSNQVQVDLVDAKSGAELWGHVYNRDAGRLLAIQQEISREVSERLGATGRPLAGAQPNAAREQAYDLYIQAIYAFHESTAESVNRATVLLRRAIEMDPTYALPHAWLGFAYLAAINSGTQPTTMVLPQARAEALKALSLDQSLPDAHYVLGYAKACDFDWNGAESEFKLALAINSNHLQSHQTYALFVLAAQGRIDDALAENGRALDVNPQGNPANVFKGRILYYAHRYADAASTFQAGIVRDPGYFWFHVGLGEVYVATARFPEAVAEINTPPYRTGGSARQLAMLAWAHAVQGDKQALGPLLNEIEERGKQSYIPPGTLAKIFGALGNKDRAFAALQQAYQDRDPVVIVLKVDPGFDPLRSDPRFHDVLRRMNLEK